MRVFFSLARVRLRADLEMLDDVKALANRLGDVFFCVSDLKKIRNRRVEKGQGDHRGIYDGFVYRFKLLACDACTRSTCSPILNAIEYQPY